MTALAASLVPPAAGLVVANPWLQTLIGIGFWIAACVFVGVVWIGGNHVVWWLDRRRARLELELELGTGPYLFSAPDHFTPAQVNQLRQHLERSLNESKPVVLPEGVRPLVRFDRDAPYDREREAQVEPAWVHNRRVMGLEPLVASDGCDATADGRHDPHAQTVRPADSEDGAQNGRLHALSPSDERAVRLLDECLEHWQHLHVGTFTQACVVGQLVRLKTALLSEGGLAGEQV